MQTFLYQRSNIKKKTQKKHKRSTKRQNRYLGAIGDGCGWGYSIINGQPSDSRCFKNCDGFIKDLESNKDPRLVINKGERSNDDYHEIDTNYSDQKQRLCFFKTNLNNAYVGGIVNNVMKDRKTGKDVKLQLPKQREKVDMINALPM